jgi:hypothetical protein
VLNYVASQSLETGCFHRLMMMSVGGSYNSSGAEGVSVTTTYWQQPMRSKEERLLSLLENDDRISELAREFATKPITWPAMRRVYESAAGIVSGDRGDWKRLVKSGWFSEEESTSFYDTASFYSHGHPRHPAKNPMDYDYAQRFISKLFWRLVDHVQPD